MCITSDNTSREKKQMCTCQREKTHEYYKTQQNKGEKMGKI